MGLMRVPGEPGAALGGEAVFLEAAVGFAGAVVFDSVALDQFCHEFVQVTGRLGPAKVTGDFRFGLRSVF